MFRVGCGAPRLASRTISRHAILQAAAPAYLSDLPWNLGLCARSSGARCHAPLSLVRSHGNTMSRLRTAAGNLSCAASGFTCRAARQRPDLASASAHIRRLRKLVSHALPWRTQGALHHPVVVDVAARHRRARLLDSQKSVAGQESSEVMRVRRMGEPGASREHGGHGALRGNTEYTERYANTEGSEESRLCVSAPLRPCVGSNAAGRRIPAGTHALFVLALTRLRRGARIERDATSNIPPRPRRSRRSLRMYHALSQPAGFEREATSTHSSAPSALSALSSNVSRL